MRLLAIVKKLLKSNAMMRCCLLIAACVGALLQSIDSKIGSRSTVDRQKLLDPEEMAL
jgi:hypothetical protein